MIHDVVDIEHWKKLCSLAHWRSEGLTPDGESVTGPWDIALVEQIRGEVAHSGDLGSRVPVDVFVFSRGEAPKQEVTKMGGLPFWPKDAPWPSLPSGRPMTFVAQICFADSRDLVEELPGDILLIFGAKGDQDDTFSFAWQTLRPVELVESAPQTDWRVAPCYGAIHRTFDYPNAKKLFGHYQSPSLLSVIEGTKIGGVPLWIQEEVEMPGHFLGTVGSIVPTWNRTYSFLNTPDPFNPKDDRDYLIWDDAGMLYLFLDDDHQVYGTVQSY